MQAFAAHQPLTVMVDAVRALTQGQAAEALLGHGAGFYVVRSLAWADAILVAFVPLAVARYRQANPAAALTRRNQRTRRQQSTFPRLGLPRTVSSYRPIRSRPSAYRQAVSTSYGNQVRGLDPSHAPPGELRTRRSSFHW